MSLLLFLIQVFVISFSGAAQPGPVTTTAIALGSRDRYAGLLLALGHGIIEFPLMLLLILGLDRFFRLAGFQITVSLAGGIVLLVMAVGMLSTLKSKNDSATRSIKAGPVSAGMILSASNPYFLLWWATIGLALATTAKGFGIWAFVLFAVVHWLVDAVWLMALSWASFKGSALLGPGSRRMLVSICAAAMFFFGAKFLFYATIRLIEMTGG